MGLLLPQQSGPEARWLAADVAGVLGSVAPFHKLKGRRQVVWDAFYKKLWPGGSLAEATRTEPGTTLTETSVTTSYMLAMTYWGFASPREPSQRAAAGEFLADLLQLVLDNGGGFDLLLGSHKSGAVPGVQIVSVDRDGCFDVSALSRGATPFGVMLTVLGCCSPPTKQALRHVFSPASRVHLVTFIICVLTSDIQLTEQGYWHTCAINFFSQLAGWVNCRAAQFPIESCASTVSTASSAELTSEEMLCAIPSLVALRTRLEKLDPTH